MVNAAYRKVYIGTLLEEGRLNLADLGLAAPTPQASLGERLGRWLRGLVTRRPR